MVKIAIIGAGISGLSQYLWLRKIGLLDNHSATIYEARGAQESRGSSAEIAANLETYNASAIGASIGLSPTGLHVLKRLDRDLYDEILRTGHIIKSWRMSNARGWTLDVSPAGGENEMMVMIGRDACCQILRKQVPRGAVLHRKVVDVRLSNGQNRPTVVFQDHQMEEFDLVIGCDGIWSRVRRAIFGAQDRDGYEYSPQYEGLVGVGGFILSSKIKGTPDGEMNVVLGANGFFGYGYTTGDARDSTKAGDMATWWSTYALNKCPDDWRNIDKEDIKKELRKRHLGWQNSAIQNIVRDVEIDSLYPTFTTPLLPTWEKGGCVLVGDAAHALQPSSGQGASMALEDGETLALLIQHYLKEDSKDGLVHAMEQYSELRRPRLDMVFKKAQQLAGMKQDMGFVQEMIMYFFIWLFSRLKVMEGYNRRLNAYNVPTEVSKATRQRSSKDITSPK
ncbi:FAD/NAD(P)-binding domain-containing protein [Xylaria intraflava]|nr:FAD/NAD(P)-binding domain-containing protein [Xylaria intraflava]